MAKENHLRMLRQGVTVWNLWSKEHLQQWPDLKRADLRGLTLSGVNLSGANLIGANLSGVDLRGSLLAFAKLINADLTEANLRGAILRGAILRGAILRGAIIDDTTQIEDKWRLVCEIVTYHASGRNLSGVDLSGANLGGTDFTGANLAYANLAGANLRKTQLLGSSLVGANLAGANLRGVSLSGVSLRGVKLDKTKLSKKWQVVWEILNDGAVGKDLSGENLGGADLRGADLRGANLKAAVLTEADLTGADLRGANLSMVNLGAVKIDKTTQLDKKWRLVWEIVTRGAVREVLAGKDLSSAYLRGAKLIETNLAGANLSRSDLTKADLTGANLANANLYLADLRIADLRVANLQGANLNETTLADANGNAANLTGAVLKGAILTQGRRLNSFESRFLDLASTQGLETIDFGDPLFLPSYLADAFDYAHLPDLKLAKIYPHFVTNAIENIKLIRTLIASAEDPPEQLIEVVKTISAELIKYLSRNPKALYRLEPRQFEELIAEILASYGWQVQLTPASKDGGYDLFAISKDLAGVQTSWIIECKKYAPDRKVGVDIVRALFGVKLDLKVANAMLATTSHFTKGVKYYKASRYDLELRDYEGILEWINAYRPNPNGKLYVKDHRLILVEDK